MDEDVAGLAHVLTGSAFGKCTRCGIASRRRRRPVRPGPHVGEPDALCERCYRAVVRDEQPAEVIEEE
jgi:hypothetical protein